MAGLMIEWSCQSNDNCQKSWVPWNKIDR